jgi:hypothetical protein
MAISMHCPDRRRSALNDPSTYWLNIMNIALGVVVLLCCAAVAYGVMQEVAARRRRRVAAAGLDREVSDLVTAYDGHAFHVPELGLTMADGGEPVDQKARTEREKR